MDPLDFPPDTALGSLDFSDPNRSQFTFFDNATWPLPLAGQNMSQQHAHQHQHHQHQHQHQNQNQHHHSTDLSSHATTSSPPRPDTITTSTLDIRTSMAHNATMAPLQTAGFAFSQGLDPSAPMLTSTDVSFNLLAGQQVYEQDSASTIDQISGFTGHFGVPLHASPIDDLTQDQINTSLASSYLNLVSSPMGTISPSSPTTSTIFSPAMASPQTLMAYRCRTTISLPQANPAVHRLITGSTHAPSPVTATAGLSLTCLQAVHL